MPRPPVWIVATVTAVVVVLVGFAAAIALVLPDRSQGELDTELEGVTVSAAEPPKPIPRQRPSRPMNDRICWPAFGGDSGRTLSRPLVDLGIPRRRPAWT